MSNSTYKQGHTAATQIRHSSRNAENTCQYFTHLLKPDMQILDVGCGPGSISASLARLIPEGKLIGIDQSEKTLQNARSQNDLPINCEFTIGDALNLDFPSNSFDVVHTSQVLVHLPDPTIALKEFYRVLKPGGFIACREGDSQTSMFYPEHPGLIEWKRCLIARHTDAAANNGRYLVRNAVKAGFDVDKCIFTGGSVTFAGAEGVRIGKTMANQHLEDDVHRQGLLENGITDDAGLQLIKEGWEAWCADPCHTFAMLCGQIVAYK